jgi:hypothetical protein
MEERLADKGSGLRAKTRVIAFDFSMRTPTADEHACGKGNQFEAEGQAARQGYLVEQPA